MKIPITINGKICIFWRQRYTGEPGGRVFPSVAPAGVVPGWPAGVVCVWGAWGWCYEEGHITRITRKRTCVLLKGKNVLCTFVVLSICNISFDWSGVKWSGQDWIVIYSGMVEVNRHVL